VSGVVEGEAGAGVGAGAGGPLAGTILAGGPRTGSVCAPLTGGPEGIPVPFTPAAGVLLSPPIVGWLTASAAGAPPSPSTTANRPSFLSLSKSNPAPFLASCFQKSYSLIHDTSTTLCPSSPPSPFAEILLSASHRNCMSNQFALAPSVLVSSRSDSSRGRWT
jgi:hypothetical protein